MDFRSSLKPLSVRAVAALALAGLPLLGALAADAPTALKPAGKTELAGYSGDFDHFAVDLAGNRLFLAAEDHGTLEVFDLTSGAHSRTVTGVETPHSVFFIPDANRLLVADSGPGMTKVLEPRSAPRQPSQLSSSSQF